MVVINRKKNNEPTTDMDTNHLPYVTPKPNKVD